MSKEKFNINTVDISLVDSFKSIVYLMYKCARIDKQTVEKEAQEIAMLRLHFRISLIQLECEKLMFRYGIK